jgi:hypothetical protein
MGSNPTPPQLLLDPPVCCGKGLNFYGLIKRITSYDEQRDHENLFYHIFPMECECFLCVYISGTFFNSCEVKMFDVYVFVCRFYQFVANFILHIAATGNGSIRPQYPQTEAII